MIQTLKDGLLRLMDMADHRRNEAERARLGQGSPGLAPEHWDATVSANGHLMIGGCDTVLLAQEFGTPLYVIDRDRLRGDYQRFRHAFATRYPKVEIGYSYKTNPLPGVLKLLHEFGAWAEVISHFELWLALALGVPTNRIVFNGPGKTLEALELAVTGRVQLINADNLDEIDTIARLATEQGIRQRVGVRVVTSVGWSSQFGLGIVSGEALEAYRRIAAHPSLVPWSMHVHLGTGVGELPVYLRAMREMLDLAVVLREKLDLELEHLDFGGGFGVATVRTLSGADVRLISKGYLPAPVNPAETPTPDTYGKAVVELVRQYYPEGGKHQPTIFFEPGRAITSSAQTLLLQVLAIKSPISGSGRVILNGGRNITMPLGYEYHEIFPANRMTTEYSQRYSLFGPLCYPGDVIRQHRPFPPLSVGDVIAIMDAGAYFVPNEMNFSNPRPAAAVVGDGKATLVRDREAFEDIVFRDGILAPPTARARQRG